MPSARDLRRRIKSVKNTAQITKAMQMVSATKMRKAQNKTLSARSYWRSLLSAIVQVADKFDPTSHPLFLPNNSPKVAVVVLSTDKGLCGSLNANIFRLLQGDFLESVKKEDIVYYTVGKKGRDFMVRTGRQLEADFPNPEAVNFLEAAKIRKFIMEVFLEEQVGKIFIVYPRFISTLRQEARAAQLLPISKEALVDVLSLFGGDNGENGFTKSEMLLEPSAGEVLDYALIHLLETRIYQILLQSKASEHSARMIAMQNATDNAKDLVADLQLTYNQMRQDAITKELLEITSAGAALE